MDRLDEILPALAKHGSKTAAAKALGMADGSFRRRYDKMMKVGQDHYAVADMPTGELGIDDLLAQRKKRYALKKQAEQAGALIPVKMKIRGPVGIWFAGDPHVDDDGTDLETLERHTDIVRETPGMFAANVGDTTNNWIGRLARLYGEQGTTASEAWALAEWLVNRCPWLFMISGNYDLWSGSGDPLQWIARQQVSIHRPSEARIGLQFHNGRQCVINARHDFAGNSQWNPAHGPMKAIQMGLRDHIAICGHKHTSGYGVLKDQSDGKICHAIQVASYKVYDRYARERGFRDQHISPCAVTIIDPDASEASFVQLFWEPEPAAEYLTWLRGKRGFA